MAIVRQGPYSQESVVSMSPAHLTPSITAQRLNDLVTYPDRVLSDGAVGYWRLGDTEAQAEIRALAGEAAQKAGRRYDWTRDGLLWWRGEPLDRLSDAYQELLDRAYAALADQSEPFRRALLATGEAQLTHSIGQSDPCETILTAEEFCTRLTQLRARQRAG